MDNNNQNTNNDNNVLVKQLCLVSDCSKLKKLRGKLLKKLENLENSEDVDINEVNNIINAINKIDELINKIECNNDNYIINASGSWINNKESFEILKGLVLGNYSYEDWQMLRLLFKVKIIEKLLNEKE